MIDRTIDSIDRFAKRFRRPIAVVAIIWFVVSWAATAHLIALPEIPFLTGKTGLIASTMLIALWWAWLSPRITKRRTERELPTSQVSEPHNG